MEPFVTIEVPESDARLLRTILRAYAVQYAGSDMNAEMVDAADRVWWRVSDALRAKEVADVD